MKLKLIQTVIPLLMMTPGLASGFSNLPIQNAEPIVSETAKGHEVRLVSGEYIPVVFRGGLGDRVSYWQLKMVIEVEEIAYEKVFRIVQPPHAGVIPANPRTYYFDFNSGNIRYLGRTAEGRGLYELSILDTSTVRPSSPFRLEVIMPAQYNRTPHIGNPVMGWYGPIVGLKNVSH